MSPSPSYLPANLPDLTSEDSAYEKGFVAYQSLRNVPDVRTYLADNLHTLVSNTSTPWRVLSVGCGDGDFDLDLLHLIAQRFPELTVEYVGLEPNQYRLDLFKEKSASRRHHHHHRRLEQMDLDQYANTYPDEKFNLILCIRVLYFMHDRLESTFEQLVNRLEEKGKLLAMHKSPSGMTQIVRLIGGDQQSPAQKCSTYHLRQALTALTARQASLRFNIVYLDGYVNITCLRNINSNDETKRDQALNLLSFLSGKRLTEIDRKLLEKVVVEQILPLIAFPVDDDDNNAAYFMFEPAGIVVVETPQ